MTNYCLKKWTSECQGFAQSVLALTHAADGGKNFALSLMKSGHTHASKESGFNSTYAMIGSATGLALLFAGYAAFKASKKTDESDEDFTSLKGTSNPLI